jgi:hypothetical protein
MAKQKSTREAADAVVAAVVVARKFSKAKPLAKRIGVCPKTVHNWGRAGLLTPHKINPRVVLYDEAEADALVESARVAPFDDGRATIHKPSRTEPRSNNSACAIDYQIPPAESAINPPHL